MDADFSRVSIVVVNYNGIEHLGDCFSSLLKLDYPKDLIEYILVDNGSMDQSVRYVKNKFPEVQILKNSRNRGFAGANNQAARTAKGEILAFLNNDMKVHPLWLRKLVDKFRQSSNDLACVSSKILNYDGDKIDFIGGGFTPFGISFQTDFGRPVEEIEDEEQDTEKELLFGCAGAMAMKKNVFLESGGFDEDFFAYLEDVDLGWRLRIMGYRILYVPESIAFHKHKGTGKHIPSHQLEFMFERNRLSTIIKNTEDAYLPYFLSMVYMFNINRTFLSTMENIEEFYFAPLGQEGQTLGTKEIRRISPSLWKKLSMMWEKGDFGIILRWFVRKNLQLITYFTGNKYIPQGTLSYSAAFNSIIPELNSLISKRKEIQSKRKISDVQIFPLFLMDKYPKQAIAKDSVSAIEKLMEFEKEIMNENRIHFPE
jgi:GT2 family glycosyltransferase